MLWNTDLSTSVHDILSIGQVLGSSTAEKRPLESLGKAQNLKKTTWSMSTWDNMKLWYIEA